ncbi:MAG: hypothetical protein ACFCU4_10170 [Puniceicoccaceae bacterium]
MFFRTKRIKNSKLVQFVESYRNAEGQPRQHVVAVLETLIPARQILHQNLAIL